jgi:hypothetical protein
MRDLKERLRDIEGFAPPDLWDEITGRERGPLPPSPAPGRRVVVAGLALAVAAVELGDLRPHHVRGALLRMQQRGLSAATIAQGRSILGSALRQAVADGIISANLVAAVKRPRMQRREPHWADISAARSSSSSLAWNGVGDPDLAGRGYRRAPLRDPRHLLVGRRSASRHGLHPPRHPAGPGSRPSEHHRVHAAEDPPRPPAGPASFLRPEAAPAAPTRTAEGPHGDWPHVA